MRGRRCCGPPWCADAPWTWACSVEDIIKPGSAMVAAGYVLYGSATVMLITKGNGVHSFVMDPDYGEFVMTQVRTVVSRTNALCGYVWLCVAVQMSFESVCLWPLRVSVCPYGCNGVTVSMCFEYMCLYWWVKMGVQFHCMSRSRRRFV